MSCRKCGYSLERSKKNQKSSSHSSHSSHKRSLKIKKSSNPPIKNSQQNYSGQNMAKKNENRSGNTEEKDFMKQLIDYNYEYLSEKTKIGCDGKPSPYYYKLPTSTKNSEYKNQYNKKSLQASHKSLHKQMKVSKPEQQSPFISTKKINGKDAYNSTYNTFYKGKQSTKVKIVKSFQADSLQEKDAPTFTQTRYKDSFLNWEGNIPVNSLKPNECPLMGGGSFSGKTNYRNDFGQRMSVKGKKQTPFRPAEYEYCLRSNTIFIGMDSPYLTSYQENFGSKRFATEKSCKPKQKKCPNKVKQRPFKTEYQGEFIPKWQQAKESDWSKLNPEQLSQMIMNL